jgi:nucleoside-diphosphate kinase
MERTLVLIKPDAVKRRLAGRILSRFEDKGLKIIAIKMMQLSREKAERHYAVHKDKPFYASLVNYIISGPIIALILEGNRSIEITRLMCGSTDGGKAQPGTIRGDYSVSVEKNTVHASDSRESFEYEYPIFFSKEEILDFDYGDEMNII